MNILSNGQPATLAGYRHLAASVFGENAAATILLDYKIEAFGADDEAPIDEAEARVLFEQINRRAFEEMAKL